MATPTDKLIAEAQRTLAAAAKALTEEMRAYPQPISGCDAQYNRLIADRNRVQSALAELSGLPFVATPRTPYQGAGIESR